MGAVVDVRNPGQLGLDDIGADRDRRDGVVARLVGHGHVLHVGRLVRGRDGDPRQRGAGFVHDEPRDRCRAGLGTGSRRQTGPAGSQKRDCDAKTA